MFVSCSASGSFRAAIVDAVMATEGSATAKANFDSVAPNQLE